MNRNSCRQSIKCSSRCRPFSRCTSKMFCNDIYRNNRSGIGGSLPFTHIVPNPVPVQVITHVQPAVTKAATPGDMVTISENKGKMAAAAGSSDNPSIPDPAPLIENDTKAVTPTNDYSPKIDGPYPERRLEAEIEPLSVVPDPPVILFPEEGQKINTAQLYIEGSADSGNIVMVYVGEDCMPTFADSSGNWAVMGSSLLVDGSYTATVTQTNGSGLQSSPHSVSFIVQIEPNVTDMTIGAELKNESDHGTEPERKDLLGQLSPEPELSTPEKNLEYQPDGDEVLINDGFSSSDFSGDDQPRMTGYADEDAYTLPGQDKKVDLCSKGLFFYRKWWERKEVDILVNGALLTGIPIFTDENTLRVINKDYSYFIPMEKIDYIRTTDGYNPC